MVDFNFSSFLGARNEHVLIKFEKGMAVYRGIQLIFYLYLYMANGDNFVKP